MDVEAYYRRYGSMVYRRCLKLLKNEEEAIDATQEVFVKLLEMAQTDVRSISSLLYVIATRHCLNRIRTASRRPETPDERLVAELAGISDTVGRSHARFVLGRLFGRNPKSSRIIAVLHFLDGLTLEQTASEVGMSVSGVRRRIRVLRKQLQTVEVSR